MLALSGAGQGSPDYKHTSLVVHAFVISQSQVACRKIFLNGRGNVHTPFMCHTRRRGARTSHQETLPKLLSNVSREANCAKKMSDIVCVPPGEPRPQTATIPA